MPSARPTCREPGPLPATASPATPTDRKPRFDTTRVESAGLATTYLPARAPPCRKGREDGD
eukprot:7134939-Prorocentrum_lima.AAC.1